MIVEPSTEVLAILKRAIGDPGVAPASGGSVASLTWGEHALTGDGTTFEIVDGQVRIRLKEEAAAIVAKAIGTLGQRPPALPLTGTITGADGAVFQLAAPQAFISELAFPPTSASLVVHASELRSTAQPQRFWLGRPRPNWRTLPSNLALEVERAGERYLIPDNFALVGGAYDYYFVRTGDQLPEHVLVIDTKDAKELDQPRLERDFQCLAFVLGQPLSMKEIVNLDDSGRVVGWRGLGWRKSAKDKPVLPVPPVPAHGGGAVDRVCEMFRRTTERIADANLHLFIPLSYYVESLTEHLDGAYLKLHVALEAFASRLLKDAGHEEKPLVADSKAWLEYVESIASDIQKYARSTDDQPILVNKVRSAQNRPTTSRVEEAFAKYGAPLSKAEAKEVSGRNRVAHAAVMSDPDTRDLARDRRRVGQVREFLVRLVSLAVGYEGTVNDAAGKPRPVKNAATAAAGVPPETKV